MHKWPPLGDNKWAHELIIIPQRCGDKQHVFDVFLNTLFHMLITKSLQLFKNISFFKTDTMLSAPH